MSFTTQLRAKLAFDPVATRKQWIQRHYRGAHQFEGAEFENARLRPLLEKLIAVVEAGEYKGCADHVRIDRVDAALEALKAEVSRG